MQNRQGTPIGGHQGHGTRISALISASQQFSETYIPGTVPESSSKYMLWYPLPNLRLGGPGQLGKFKIKGTIWIPSWIFEKIDFFWFMVFLGKKLVTYNDLHTGNL